MIRQLDERDAKAFYDIRLLSLTLHPEAFGTGAGDWRKATEAQVGSILSHGTSGDRVFGAFGGETLVGVIGLKHERKFSIRHKGTLWGFFVRPAARGRGVGRSLIEHVIGYANAHPENHYLRTIVTLSPQHAEGLFLSQGFVRYGLEKSGIKVDGTTFDQAYLQRMKTSELPQ